ncbi:MAG TPA: FliM/FliN family flagellar motor C-terminal domain-containing protein [Terriglobia bacterium]|nr:FliM/FliN family flagellar motor C-terminal domain-containing protein [Terriglobia bacterium]
MSLSTPESAPAAPVAANPWDLVQALPFRVRVEIPVSGATVGQILGLRVGSIIDTGQEEGTVVGVWVHDQRIAWGRFEVIADRLAIHLIEVG